jgi:hypothetical protein
VADDGYGEESHADVDLVLEHTGGGVSQPGCWWNEKQFCIK